MTRPRSYQTEAIVIKKTKLGEADRILTLLTPGRGKLQAVAKGVRRPRSKLSGHLELLSHSQVSLARGRNLDTITGSQTLDAFLPLRESLERTAYGLYLAELVNQFTPEEAGAEALFRLLLDTLQELCQADISELLLRRFELRVLEIAGYRPELNVCASCHKPLTERGNAFSPDAGGVVCPLCRSTRTLAYPISEVAVQTLRFLQENDYPGVRSLRVEGPVSREVEAVLRSYLGYLLEREIRSTAWLDTLRRSRG